VARLADGSEVVAPLGSIPIVAGARPAPATDLIAVCLATFDPGPELLAVQLDSLRAQTDERWHCVISDDGSSPERFAALRDQVEGDARFTLERGERLGFYRNFERALGLAPPEAGLIALCDQDDRWEPDKLATLRGALGDAAMVFSDQRLVDPSGRVLRDTLWVGRRNNHTDLAALLVANSVTGAATLMRREVAELAVPFPEPPGVQFHDHWLGLVALTMGDIAYVDRPLYDYVQHRGAVFGEVSGGERAGRRGGPLRYGRGAYFLGYVPRVVQARTLLARLGPRTAPAKRRALERFLDAQRSPVAFAWLAARGFTRRRQTLGSEVELLAGILWRRVVTLLGRRGDARFPDLAAFEQRRLRRWRATA
jgi:glycosyltransferase involved in cell wall biosynthesis